MYQLEISDKVSLTGTGIIPTLTVWKPHSSLRYDRLYRPAVAGTRFSVELRDGIETCGNGEKDYDLRKASARGKWTSHGCFELSAQAAI